MRLSITSAVKGTIQPIFEKMLTPEDFPEVAFSRTEGRWVSYNMIEYGTAWSTFAKVVDQRIKETGLDPSLGVFTRKRSKDFIAKLENIAKEVTVKDVRTHGERFKTWFD